jgi:hypothetical protein
VCARLERGSNDRHPVHRHATSTLLHTLALHTHCCRWDIAMEFVPEDDGIDPPMPEEQEREGQEQEASGEAAAAASG